MRHYRQLTLVERYQIQAAIGLGMSIGDIAIRLGRHRSTLFRELKRNGHLSREGYAACSSQQDYELRRKRCRRPFLVRDHLKRYVNSRLRLQWSPEQIVGRRRLESPRGPALGVETLYRYIYRDKVQGGILWMNLRHCRHGRRRKRFRMPRWPSQNPRPSALDRPAVIERRTRAGDFERDLIVGSQHRGYVMTIVDRRSRLVHLRKLARPDAESTHLATVDALRRTRVRSITNDNGREFFAHQATAEALQAPVFFTRPYAAWERGTVENTNKLVRQYLPKSMPLQEIPNETLKMVETLLNYRPRKTLGYRTPIEASA
jgi:IS30 family transposase